MVIVFIILFTLIGLSCVSIIYISALLCFIFFLATACDLDINIQSLWEVITNQFLNLNTFNLNNVVNHFFNLASNANLNNIIGLDNLINKRYLDFKTGNRPILLPVIETQMTAYLEQLKT